MKKLFKSALMFAAAAMAFTGCSDKEELEPGVVPGEESGNLTLFASAEFEDQTRAEFEGGNGGQMVFSDGDKIVLNYMPEGFSWSDYSEMTYDANNRIFKTNRDIKPIKEGTDITIDKKDDIPAVQKNSYTDGYFNLNLLAFTADPVTFTPGMQQGNEVYVNFTFKHVASYMQIRFVTEDPAIVGKAVKSVRFEAPGVSTGNNYVQVNFDGLSSQPTVVNKADAKNYNNVAYLAVLPGKHTGNFVIETMDGDSYTIPVNPENPFERAHVRRIALNLKAAAPAPDPKDFVYTRLTSDNINNLLVDGAEFVILGADNAKKDYVSNVDGDTYMYGDKVVVKKFSAEVLTNVVTPEEISAAGVRVFKLKRATTDNAWLIQDIDGRYLFFYSSWFLLGEDKAVEKSYYQYEITVIPGNKTNIKCLGGSKKALSMMGGFLKSGNSGGSRVNTSIFVKTVK